MKLSFFTLVCPDWTAEEIATNARKCGYDGVDLSARHQPCKFTPELNQDERKRLRKTFEDNGVEISMVNTYSCFVNGDEKSRAENVQMVKDFVELARDLGSQRIRVFGENAATELPADVPKNTCLNFVADSIAEIADFAKSYGIGIFLETHDVFCEPDLVAEVMGKINASNVEVIWDVTNSMRTGKTVAQGFATMKDFIAYVQIKDYYDVQKLHRPCLIGEGENPCGEALELLKEINYDGYCCLETEKQYHPEPEVPGPEVSLPQFVEFMKNNWA